MKSVVTNNRGQGCHSGQKLSFLRNCAGAELTALWDKEVRVVYVATGERATREEAHTYDQVVENTRKTLLKLVSRDRAIIDLLRMEQGSRIFMDSMADIEDQTHLQCCQPMVLYIQNHLKIHADGSVIVLYGSVMVL